MRNIHIFGIISLVREIKRALRRIISRVLKGKRFHRNPEHIKSIYQPIREDVLARLGSLNFDQYCFDVSYIEPRWNLYRNKILFGFEREIRLRRLNYLVSYVGSAGLTNIVEIGSGDGSNIIFLAERFRDKNFFGLELSKTSVELSKAAAKKFGLTNVKFFEADLSDPQTFCSRIDSKSLVFSLHCLEEMPRIFKIPLKILNANEVPKIVLLEPIVFFKLQRFFLDLARLVRIFHHDRLFGLLRFCRRFMSSHYHIEYIDLGMGTNPVNPTSLLVLTRKK